MNEETLTMECPHCGVSIQLIEINCGILRCGIYQLKNGKIRQLPKHGSKHKIHNIKEKYGKIKLGSPIYNWTWNN